MSQMSVSPNRTTAYHHVSSPASTISDDDDSNHSEPNDLRTSQKSRHHAFGGYPSFYSPPQSHAGGGNGGGHSGHSAQPQYAATNECRLIDYRGARIAAFLAANRQGEYLLCLPQAFELFLKHLVGGLHTVYTKLKRLDIVPIVCNVEQVRILRGLGAIQPGVNRCKLLSTHDFDVLYKDCTTARPGRPPKRSSGIPSPEPGNFNPASTPLNSSNTNSNNLLPLLGFNANSANSGNGGSGNKKARYSDDCDYDIDLKQLNSANLSNANSAATAAAMLAANGYSAAFPFLQHLSAAAAANSLPTSQQQQQQHHQQQQQQQLVAAAAALGLPGLPNRFANNSPPPGVHPQTPHYPNPNSGGGGGNGANVTGVNSGSAPAATTGENAAAEFNPTAAYLWLLSQQQQHLPNAAAAAAALNLSSRTMAASSFLNGGSPLSNGPNGASLPMANPTNGMPDSAKEKERSKSNEEHKSNGVASNGQTQNLMSTIKKHRDLDDDDDDTSTDDDDVESTNSNSNHSENPVSSSGFNGSNKNFLDSGRNSSSTPTNGGQAATGTTGSGGSGQPEHCLETLLRNIEGLLAIAAHNARQQQTQLQLQKAELRADYSSQLERERELREHVEKQYQEEQKIRIIYQKRFKKERKLRRKLEHELNQQNHNNQQQQQQASSQLPPPSSQSLTSTSVTISPPTAGNGGTPINNLTPVSNNTKSPVSSLPPTPPPQSTSSDEAE